MLNLYRGALAIIGLSAFYAGALNSILASAAMLGNPIDALPKMLAQVGVCLGMSVWGHFAAKRQTNTTWSPSRHAGV